MAIHYGFVYRDETGKRRAKTVHHACCFGALGNVQYHYDRNQQWRPLELDWVAGQVVVSVIDKAEDFRYWWKRLRKDFPTYTVNGVKHKMPKGVYYDAKSTAPGNLNRDGRGALEVNPNGSYVVLTFPEGTTDDVLYVGLKFYMKNLMNPSLVGGLTMCGLWAKAERKLKEAGFKKPTMAMIMAVNSMADSQNTINYGWPVNPSNIFVGGLKHFLTYGYECVDFVDNKALFHIHKQMNIFNSKSAPKHLMGWHPREGIGRLQNQRIQGYAGAIEMIKEALA